MLIDARTVERDAVLRSDLCIVGAGAAGIPLARALERTGASIALVESGGWNADPEVQSLYEGEAKGDLVALQPDYLCSSRLRYFGGSTNHWSGWCAPLEPIDFEERPWVPHSGWPISREELEPYYRRAAEVLELAPLEEPHGEPSDATRQFLLAKSRRVVTRFFRFSPPTRLGAAHRDALTRSEQVTVLLHANVIDLQAAGHGASIERALVACLGGRRFTLEARCFVLAAGGVENARLLLLSNGVQRAGLGNGYDLVGRYFADHPHLDAAFLALTDPALSMELYDLRHDERGRRRPLGVLSIAADAQREHRLLNLRAHLWPSSAEEAGELGADVEQLAGHLDGLPDEEDGSGARTFRVRVSCECPPEPESRVRLADEVDALGTRRAKLELRIGEQAHASLRRSVAILGRELGLASQGRLRIVLDEQHPWAKAWGGSHHLGTTRMSADPARGVVDADGRVHGLANLYIAGSSVFPTYGYANPTLTIVALSLRLADLLERELGG